MAAGFRLSPILFIHRHSLFAGHSGALINLISELSMARTFKLKCRLFISSFRFCRPKHPLTFPVNPLPVSYLKYKQPLPNDPKPCDICYPHPPSPPPSTPMGFFTGRLLANTVSVCCGCKMKSYTRENGLLVSQEGSRTESEDKIPGEENQRSPFSWITRKKTKKKAKKMVHKSKQMANSWSNGYDGEEDEGTEALINSSISFSDEFSHKQTDSMKITENENEVTSRNLNLLEGKENNAKVEAPGLKHGVGSERRPTTATSDSEREEKSAAAVEGKLWESCLVEVKRSKQPHEDFKRSMAQMILEKEIFEEKGLEELLQCYLRLNPPEYHGVIVGAFSEVWDFLFYDSQLNK